ncbi:MAG: aminotransferase class I/II-fold pyridoxal phosphate-dependent enzyme [Lachnospiraceae bacterium]
MREFSKKAMGLKPSGIRKFFDLANEIPDVISLGVGEPDFDTPWMIREAGIQAIRRGKTFYTSNAGLAELRDEICTYTKRKTGLSYTADNVLVTVGGSEAIDLALRALLNPGDEVICVEPCFVSYAPCVTLADGVPVVISLKEEDSFRLKRAQLEAAITPKTKVLMLSYPNNPTGAVMQREDYEALLEVILAHDLFVISDEIYSELTYEGVHCSIASLPGMQERTLIVQGFSKAFAMTGWRLGYALGPQELIALMTKIHQFAIMCSPTISQYAAVEALRSADDEVEQMRESYDQRRRYLVYMLKELEIPCFEPFGAFYLFPHISRFGLSSEVFAERLLQEEKVAVVPGNAFGGCGEGFIRVSYATSIDELKKAMQRIKKFVVRLSGE